MSALGLYYPEHRARRAVRRDMRLALKRTIGILSLNGEFKQIEAAHALLTKLNTTDHDQFMAHLSATQLPEIT
jgi:hypothetical protein